MDPHLSEQRVGSRISLVALVDGIENNTMQCEGISPQQSFSLLISGGLALGKYTFYGLVVRETGTHVVCEADQSTRCFSIMDLCNSMKFRSSMSVVALVGSHLVQNVWVCIHVHSLSPMIWLAKRFAATMQRQWFREAFAMSKWCAELMSLGLQDFFRSPADFLVNLTQDKVTWKVWQTTEVKHWGTFSVPHGCGRLMQFSWNALQMWPTFQRPRSWSTRQPARWTCTAGAQFKTFVNCGLCSASAFGATWWLSGFLRFPCWIGRGILSSKLWDISCP